MIHASPKDYIKDYICHTEVESEWESEGRKKGAMGKCCQEKGMKEECGRTERESGGSLGEIDIDENVASVIVSETQRLRNVA
jgi:hypothetical protein